MNWVIYGLTLPCVLWMAFEDIKLKTVSLAALAGFATGAAMYQVQQPEPEGIYAALILSLTLIASQALVKTLKKRPVLGIGDLVVFPLCGLWLYVSEIPFFLLTTGLLAFLTGIFWQHYWNMLTFPLTPAIFTSLLFVLLNRCL